MSILWTIIIGFVAGVIAKFIMPGPNEPSGFILTTILGIVGAFVASYLGQALGWYAPGEGAGLIGAVVGAIIIAVALLRLNGTQVAQAPAVAATETIAVSDLAQSSQPQSKNIDSLSPQLPREAGESRDPKDTVPKVERLPESITIRAKSLAAQNPAEPESPSFPPGTAQHMEFYP